jgi:probable F420-dependent oxidoreductase
MRLSLGLPVDRIDAPDEFQTGRSVMEIAAAADAAGFDAVFVTDHPLPESEWLAAGGHQAMDPFVALSFAAAGSRRVGLHTNLAVLPYRSPYVTAKAVASLDRLSGGRMLLGVGAGYLEPEFAALGADFERRNELSDTAIVEMRKVWSGEPVQIGAHRYQALPRPLQRPHPPIWGGGNSQRAIRRAVELCVGWMPFPNPAGAAERVRTPALLDLGELARRIAFAREHAERVGRKQPLDIVFSPLMKSYYGMPGFSQDELFEQVGKQSELGVTWMTIILERTGRPAVPTLEQFVERVQGFGAEVIRKLPPASARR